jgi:HPt (histidine-containing phosphotransfer) domain-containing protein
MLRAEPFDAVLMDVQMPDMDGFTATGEIRGDGALAGTPVIAMTANASTEDQERCRAAGMDDVVTKPVFPERLYAVLAQQLSRRAATRPAPAPADSPTGAAADTVIDLEVLSRMVGRDPQKLHKYAVMFLSGARSGLEEMDAALERQAMDTLSGIGHRFKSSARAVGAVGFGELCQGLESLKRQEDAAQARQIVDELHALLERIAEEIDRLPTPSAAG